MSKTLEHGNQGTRPTLSTEQASSLVVRIEQKLRAGVISNRSSSPPFDPQMDRIVIGENCQPHK